MSESKDGLRRTGGSNVESPTTESGHFDAYNSSADGISNNLASSGNKSIVRNTLNISSSPNTSKLSSPPSRPLSIDPLSQHILKRTHTENTIPQKLRNAGLSESTNTDGGSGTPSSPKPEIGSQYTPELSRSDSNLTKEKKKGAGVSFLSRFSIPVLGGKKKDIEDNDDNESEFGENRTSGMNANAFSTSIRANGYIPQHKEPPRYIKVRAHNKKTAEFGRLFLAQELDGTAHISNHEISRVSTSTTSEVRPQSPNKLSKPPPKLGGAVWTTEFSLDGRYLAVAGQQSVVRIYAVISSQREREAHEREEDALNTSERLSAPVFGSKPYREFKSHTGDILDLSWSKNNFLLSSSMDKTVRLWHVSREECLVTFKHKDFVTSIAFHPTDDRFFLAGSLDAVLRLWSIPDKSVAFWTQLPEMITAVSFSPNGQVSLAGTLSGLCFFYVTEGLKYQTQILVRSSRGKNSKGSKITGIRTAVLPHGDPEGEVKVLVTSNDSRIRLYNLRGSLETKFKGLENTCSQIKASFSQDGKHIICGSEDRKVYIWSNVIDSENKEKTPVEVFEAHSHVVTTAIFAPTKSRELLVADPIFDLCNPPPVTLLSRNESNVSSMPNLNSEKMDSDEHHIKKPEETPAYIARKAHKGGNIIITADYSGSIKVFRQDCAYQKRRNEWETNSNFSKKMLGKTNSIRTRNSNSSRRSSISSPNIGGSEGHILSWRSGVERGAKSTRSDRSISPGKVPSRTSVTSITNSQNNLAHMSRQQPYATTPLTTASSITTTSPPQSLHKSAGSKIGQLPTPSFTFTTDNPLKLDSSGRSYQFWNRGTFASTPDALRPPMMERSSQVSKLSSEEASPDEESDGEALSCKKCNGKNFKARKVAGKAKLVCTKCFATVE